MRTDAPEAEGQPEYVVARGVLDLLCPWGHIVEETQDRRWLWSIHQQLANAEDAGDASGLPGLREALNRYLSDTCEHHWESLAEDGKPSDEKCLWCAAPRPRGKWFGQ